jgi:4-hydroxyphenylpyruvate dioxygenase-like putative hemolysin
MTIKTYGIDHIHFNIRNIKRFLEIMQQLFGPNITPISNLQQFGFYNACVNFDSDNGAQAFMDVFQSAEEDSFVANHIRTHGQGVSFVSFRVDDLEGAAAHAAKCGLREISRDGYRGMKQVQFDTMEELGFYLEFVSYEPGFHAELEEIKKRLRKGETVDGLRYIDPAKI